MIFQNFFLHTDQPAVFVVVGSVTQFIDRMTQNIKFFVSYEIKCEMMTAKMILNAGEVQIGFKNICAGDSDIFSLASEGW